MSVSVAIAAGGTGGHLVPALAVIEALRAQQPDVEITLIGSRRHLDESLASRVGVRVAATDAISFSSRRELPCVALRLAGATRQVRRLLTQVRATAVLGFGGYPSLPTVLAARTLRRPVLVHEANALPRLGLANRFAARCGGHVYAGFEPAGRDLRRRPRLIGVPIRRAIATLDRAARRADARAQLRMPSDAFVVLVIGGSLGAGRLNETIVALGARGLPDGWAILGSTGAEQYPQVSARVTDPNIRLEPFLDDMASAYAAADVVVARAGASTVAELDHLGLPSVLVPLPIARLGEQDANAKVLASTGLARVVSDADLDADRFVSEVRAIASAPRGERSASGELHASAAASLATVLLATALRAARSKGSA